MRPLVLQITGMSCGHCLHAVSSSLAKLSGVTVRTVRIGRAEVEFDPATTSLEAIVAAVADAGYSAVPAGS